LKEELVTLVEEKIVKAREEVTVRIFFPKVKASSFVKTTH
jgi:hypothetical protein